MEELTSITSMTLELWQFIALCSFLIANTAAIIGAWYRYGYRITSVEKEHKELKEVVNKIVNSQDEYVLQGQCIAHLQGTKDTYNKFTDTLNEVKQMMITLQSRIDIHLAIHDERENPKHTVRSRHKTQ